ncbi:MFS general substrate transporter [Nadsonia fulvescens var. elongata DSM 6958]|uniref:MFS general substrate transporter n=1 Tax=Nadsonia fulvescens var. elongata DSM 6958 TaxID=857566 RepID=A0A1E3PJ03_9ASCO|nr:MFS general substrate transporter [Nadsonia fulvescens var. elongata DSM 6958]
MTPEELKAFEIKFKRRIDLRILPMIVLIYILNYLDRNNIATARLAGLERDLNLTSVQYQTSVSILFVGYILMQIPSNMLIDRLGRPGLYLTLCMLVWGVVSTCTSAVQSYGGLVATRFILGFVEAAYFPGCLFFLSSWYTKKELAFRTAVLYSGSLISGAFAGLIGAGIVDGMDGVKGLAAWRWLFLIEGVITIAIVPIAYLVLPDFPATTKWLSEQERDMALWRMRRDVGQDDSNGEKQTKKQEFSQGFQMAIKDIKVWLNVLIMVFIVGAAGVTNFFPTVVGTLNYSRTITLCLTAPPYLLAVFLTFGNALHTDKTGERYWHATIPLWVGIVSFIVAVATTSVGARYFAMMIMIPGIYCGFVVYLSWLSNIIPRPASKRAVSIALMNCISNSSSIWNAYLYPRSASPRYITAFTCNAVFLLIAIALTTLLSFLLKRDNKKLENGTFDVKKEFGPNANVEATLRTFRYPY